MATPQLDKDYYSELKSGIDELTTLFYRYKKNENIEIELRLGRILDTKFQPGLGSEEFYILIKKKLDSCNHFEKKISTTTEELIKDGIRKTVSLNGKKVMKQQCIRKDKLYTSNFEYTKTPYDIRISVAKEIPIEEKIRSGLTRKKQRTSYYYKDYRFDLTKVEQIDNSASTVLYEFEVEFINLNNGVSDIYRAHSGFLLIRDIINMCEDVQKDSKLIKQENLVDNFGKMNI